MTYQVLYRVWRPQNFKEIVGQEHIRRTLENAIKNNRISHAYLFCGPRGTGKTSIARILAKALNCANPDGIEPCGQCDSCKAITDGSSMDVMEIDGASNRGIDQIRDLREKIGFLPSMGKYRVVIIDEVHMLSTEAFNALLKTLEEPPEHVIFILATTDPQKIPATILSRCQRFDFKKIPSKDIKDYLKKICESLNVKAEEEAIDVIVRKAEGGMRDAISLLDQSISFSSDQTLKYTEVCDVLGITGFEELSSLTDSLISGSADQLFTELENSFSNGREPALLLKDFYEYLRNLLFIALCAQGKTLTTLPGFLTEKAESQAKALGAKNIETLLNKLGQVLTATKAKGNIQYMAETFFADCLLSLKGEVSAPVEKPKPKKEEIIPVIEKEPEPEPIPVIEEIPKPEPKEEPKSFDWSEFLAKARGKSISLQAFLKASSTQKLENGVLTAYFSEDSSSFHKQQCEKPDNLAALNDIAKELFGASFKCAFEQQENVDPLEKAKQLFGEDIFEIKTE